MSTATGDEVDHRPASELPPDVSHPRSVRQSLRSHSAAFQKFEPRAITTLLTVVILLASVSGMACATSHSPGAAEPPKGSEGALPSAPPAPLVHPAAHASATGHFTLTLITSDINCYVYIDGQLWLNNTSNDTETYGFHSIQAAYCPHRALQSWVSTAGPVNGANISPTYLYLESNGTLTANFVTGYNVTFNESGLVVGTQWALELAGSGQNAPVNYMQFEEPNGSYGYAITPFTDYVTKYSGTVHVHGADVTIQVVFTPIIYEVRFLASGLPSETTWVVTLNNSTTFAKTIQIGFAEVNGTYSYKVWQIPGYHSNVTRGRAVVAGQPQVIYVSYTQNSTSSASIPAWEIAASVGAVAALIAGTGVVLMRARRGTPPKGLN